MRYWAYIGDAVKGPFEKEALRGHPDFRGAMLVCPESPDGGQAGEWKEAASFPELADAAHLARSAEPQLAMTMRGTLIMPREDAAGPASPVGTQPAPATASAVVSRAVTGTPGGPSGASGLEPDPTPAQLRNKMDQLGAMLLTIGNNQNQLIGKINGLEAALAELKAMVMPPPPRKNP